MHVVVARTRRQRLIGLLGRREPPPYALRLDRCRSVHTFGMRFPLDLVWLGPDDAILRIDRAVRPWRVRSCRQAVAIVEVPCPTVRR
jgi:uncharacterized membrane protein (UPF0127 family)